MVTRDAIFAAARSWLGTPYHHQASSEGCRLGLPRIDFGESGANFTGWNREAMPPSTRGGNASGSETLLAAAARHLVQLDDPGAAGLGDVMVFRMRDGGVANTRGSLQAPGAV